MRPVLLFFIAGLIAVLIAGCFLLGKKKTGNSIFCSKELDGYADYLSGSRFFGDVASEMLSSVSDYYQADIEFLEEDCKKSTAFHEVYVLYLRSGAKCVCKGNKYQVKAYDNTSKRAVIWEK